MHGKIKKAEEGWMVEYTRDSGPHLIPLHPDDVEAINELGRIFDDVDARVLAAPNIEFDIIENQKLSGISLSAKIKWNEDHK